MCTAERCRRPGAESKGRLPCRISAHMAFFSSSNSHHRFTAPSRALTARSAQRVTTAALRPPLRTYPLPRRSAHIWRLRQRRCLSHSQEPCSQGSWPSGLFKCHTLAPCYSTLRANVSARRAAACQLRAGERKLLPSLLSFDFTLRAPPHALPALPSRPLCCGFFLVPTRSSGVPSCGALQAPYSYCYWA